MVEISNTYGLKIFHTSDLHGNHEQLVFDKDVDVMIISGDSTNYHDEEMNKVEWDSFIEWYSNIPIPIKIYVPGNHDCYVYHNTKKAKKQCEDGNIELLIKRSIKVNGLNIYGDPTTPEYGYWYFMAQRDKMYKHWSVIPEDVDILVTHGPPKGILDVSPRPGGAIELTGDTALLNRIENLRTLKLNCFGHIHDNRVLNNTGILYRNGVYYSNAAAVKDGQMGVVVNHGHYFKL